MTTRLEDLVKPDTPRLAVEYKCVNGEDQFRWGIIGNMPVLSLIGYVTDAINQLADPTLLEERCTLNECIEPGHLFAIVATDPDSAAYFVGVDVPVYPLVGMLEIVKAMLINSRIAQMAAANVSPIIGPNGQPVKRGIT